MLYGSGVIPSPTISGTNRRKGSWGQRWHLRAGGLSHLAEGLQLLLADTLLTPFCRWGAQAQRVAIQLWDGAAKPLGSSSWGICGQESQSGPKSQSKWVGSSPTGSDEPAGMGCSPTFLDTAKSILGACTAGLSQEPLSFLKLETFFTHSFRRRV